MLMFFSDVEREESFGTAQRKGMVEKIHWSSQVTENYNKMKNTMS